MFETKVPITPAFVFSPSVTVISDLSSSIISDDRSIISVAVDCAVAVVIADTAAVAVSVDVTVGISIALDVKLTEYANEHPFLLCSLMDRANVDVNPHLQ